MISALVATAACLGPGYVQVGDEGGSSCCDGACSCVDSDVLYESDGQLGVGTTTPDADLHVDGTLLVTGDSRFGHGLGLAKTTTGCGYGALERPIALAVERQAGVDPQGYPVLWVVDRAEGTGTVVNLVKAAGNGGLANLVRKSGGEATVYVGTYNTVDGGQSLHVQHSGDGIGVTIDNSVMACRDSADEWIHCIDPSTGQTNPDVVSRPGGDLIELIDASGKNTFDIRKTGFGPVFGVKKEDVPGDGSSIILIDNRSATAHAMTVVDYTTGKNFFVLSKQSLRLAAGVKLGIGSADQIGEPQEALHVMDGNVLLEAGNLTVSDGYIKFGRTYRQPPEDDCAVQADIGKTKVEADDDDDDLLWVCGSGYTWRYTVLQ